MDEIIESVLMRVDKAETIHGDFPNCSHKALCILAEEVGEVAKAINDKDEKQIGDELLDVMAVCCRWLDRIAKNDK